MTDTLARNVVMHGGHTDRMPTDLTDLNPELAKKRLTEAAQRHFQGYIAERPQCVFDEPEIWVQEDVMRMTLRGEWRATAFVSWR